MKPILARQMEVYAGFLEYADHHTGRVIDALEELGILDDTLIYYIIGDNGASAEGGSLGTFMITTTVQRRRGATRPSSSGTSTSTSSAARTPTTTTPSAGRTRCARRTSGPSRSPRTTAAPATARSCTGRRRSPARARSATSGTTSSTWRRPSSSWPDSRSRTPSNGVTQIPMQGVSMAYSFDDADADERHTTQYFEMMGNRGIYHDGWTAVTLHRSPFDLIADGATTSPPTSGSSTTRPPTGRRRTTCRPSSPEKLAELQQLWLIEAVRHNVLPMDDRAAERMNPEIAGRPSLVRGHDAAALPGHDPAQRERRAQHQEPVVPGHRRDRRPRRRGRRRDRRAGRPHRWLGPLRDRGQARPTTTTSAACSSTTIAADAASPTGTHQVRAEFAYDGGGIGSGGDVTLYVDGNGGRQRPRRAHPRRSTSPSTRASTSGWTRGMPVFEGYTTPKGAFTGTIAWGQVDLGDDDHSHLIDPEDHLAAAMLHQ